MNKRFCRGLVVGKFSPLHQGHEFVIQNALRECDEVFLISYSMPEYQGCEAFRREEWLAELFPQTRRLVVTDEKLKKWKLQEFSEIPSNDAPDLVHRQFVGALCCHVFGTAIDAVFTSESYGKGFAGELTNYFRCHLQTNHLVRHIKVDQLREKFPISGTLLRADIHQHRHRLAPFVYGSFVKRICILGGESSGKSTLAAALAAQRNTEYVSEYGRELWMQRNGNLLLDDMIHIARRQLVLEETAARRANQYLFCDTSPLTTLFYSQHLFRQAVPELERLAERSYDVVILCAPDFPFVQDGTRQTDLFRAQQHEWYCAELKARRIPYLVVNGTVKERITQIARVL